MPGENTEELLNEQEAQALFKAAYEGKDEPPSGSTTTPPQPGEVTPGAAATDTQTEDGKAAPKKGDSQQQKDATQQTQTQQDEWAGVPAPLKQFVAEARQTMAGMDQRLRSAEGRVGKMQQEVAAAVAAKSAVSPSDQPSQAAIADASKSGEKWEKLKKEFPEWADALEERLAQAAKPTEPAPAKTQQPAATSGDDNPLSQTVQQQQAVIEQQAETLRELQVEVRHPGWQETVKTPEFGQWLRGQNPDLQMLAGSPQPADAVKLLDAYADFKKGPQPQNVIEDRQRRLANSATPGGDRTGAPRQATAETPEEVWKQVTKEVWNEPT